MMFAIPSYLSCPYFLRYHFEHLLRRKVLFKPLIMAQRGHGTCYALKGHAIYARHVRVSLFMPDDLLQRLRSAMMTPLSCALPRIRCRRHARERRHARDSANVSRFDIHQRLFFFTCQNVCARE